MDKRTSYTIKEKLKYVKLSETISDKEIERTFGIPTKNLRR